jgi:beta-galactosidase
MRRSLLAALLGLTLTLLPLANLSGAPSEKNIPTQLPGRNAILMGTDWYPEQWPESRWETEVHMMEEAHLHVVRLAEFAWSSMEPSEGRFEFAWLDRAIRLLEKHHIAVVLGTPSAGPPAWLTYKFPETLRIESDGRPVTHGTRAQGSVTSAKYRELSRRIAEEMAKHYGNDADVAGWQIDNEYGYAQISYDDGTKKQFQDWLRDKYKTLDALNLHWAAAYWSQTYNDWAEIPIPLPNVGHNPALLLEWKRFITYAWDAFQQNQIDVIRNYANPRQFITGNFMGIRWDALDQYKTAAPLTFASWDNYVGTGHLDPDANGMSHDGMRGLKRENFWVIETQPGAVNWSDVNNFLNKGETRAMAWHAIAHGADDVSYWQWRSAPNGQEEMHGTLVGADGTPEPLLEEVTQTAKEFEQTEAAFRGTRVVSEVALLNDYESRWAIDWQKHNRLYNTNAVALVYYKALRKVAQSMDVVSPYAPLEAYKLVVAPDLNLIPEPLAKHLLEYVNNGGHLVLGPRAGLKDEYNALLPQRQPGFLADALGARVEQFYALERNAFLYGPLGNGYGSLWAEQLKVTDASTQPNQGGAGVASPPTKEAAPATAPQPAQGKQSERGTQSAASGAATAAAAGTQVLLRFGTINGWLDNQPAVVSREVGKGSITYVGAVLDDTLAGNLAEHVARESGVKPVFGPVPDGVEVSRRVGANKQIFVFINFSQQPKTIALPHPMKSLLEDKATDSFELPPYGVGLALDQK